LERLLRDDDGNVRNREAILEMIASSGNRDRDALEREIKRKYPQDYAYLLSTLYPRLRAVSFKYDLRRVGMVKDTIHTTVPDTLYARGVALLKGRRYDDALNVLGGFRDRNAAICMMSLGLDERAYNTLKRLPEHSTHRYLLAIVCARLGREDEAIEHFARAVELNPVLQYRGRLDPEISNLITSRDGTTEK
jgi:tetratricopeptide (TPR) repeat protein